MMKALLAAIHIAGGLVCAQTAVTSPQAGWMRDTANFLRPVYGIAGNFLVGDPVAAGVASAAYSGSYGLVKTASTLLVIDSAGAMIASDDAPDGPALFAFANTGEPALAYLPDAGTLLVWTAGAFSPVPFDPTTVSAAAVVSVALPDSYHAALIVQRDDGLWDVRVVLASGEIDAQTAIPGVGAPVLMLPGGGFVYGDGNGTVLRKPDGSERHIRTPLPAAFEFEQMGRDWIQVRDLAGGSQFAVRVTESREQSYQLPEVAQ